MVIIRRIFRKNTLQGVFALLLSGIVNLTLGQEFRIPLYNGPIPGTRDTVIVETSELQYNMTMIRKVQTPDIAVYLPSKRNATGQAVVVCPGGGYWVLEMTTSIHGPGTWSCGSNGSTTRSLLQADETD